MKLKDLIEVIDVYSTDFYILNKNYETQRFIAGKDIFDSGLENCKVSFVFGKSFGDTYGLGVTVIKE